MLILQCIIFLQSQSIEFKNTYSKADITCGEPLFIELTKDFNIDVEQHDVVLKLNKSLYCQAEDAWLWYENLQNGLLDSGSVAIKVYPCLFMSKTVICVVYGRGRLEVF